MNQEKFWSKVRIEGWMDCWLWTGTLAHGYGQFGRNAFAHRVAYELLVGPIPQGFQIDHVRAWGCVHRHCVNPAHLEAVTQAENIQRGDAGQHQARKTHCPQGHPYDEANTYVDANAKGGPRRFCRTCRRERWRSVS